MNQIGSHFGAESHHATLFHVAPELHEQDARFVTVVTPFRSGMVVVAIMASSRSVQEHSERQNEVIDVRLQGRNNVYGVQAAGVVLAKHYHREAPHQGGKCVLKPEKLCGRTHLIAILYRLAE